MVTPITVLVLMRKCMMLRFDFFWSSQDTMGGRFDVTQSFTGGLSDLQFWSRVLTSNEIHNQATCTSHLTGDVMSWSEELVELHGGLTEVPFDPCH